MAVHLNSKFELFLSDDCGCTYQKVSEASALDDLKEEMSRLDDAGLRWYVTKDGEDIIDIACAIHRNFYEPQGNQ